MTPLLRTLCFGLLLVLFPSSLFARGASSSGGSRSSGGFGGGSRSSSSSSYSSRSSSSSSYSSGGSSSTTSTRSSSGWGTSAPASSGSSSSGSRSTGSSNWGSSSRFGSSSSTSPSTNSGSGSSGRSSASSGSSTDRALAAKTAQGGSTFSTRAEATHDFEQKYAAQYPSTFSREPSTRPSYVPQYNTVNGSPYPVYYDANYGGYGSWINGSWMAYSVVRDVTMLNLLMNNRGYSYADGPGYAPTYMGNQRSTGSVFGGLVVLFICILLLIVVIIALGKIFGFVKRGLVSAISPSAEGRSVAATATKTPSPKPGTVMDKNKISDWLSVKPNSVITLTDAQGIADSMKRGQGVRGIDYTVQSVAAMVHLQQLSTHLFFTLADPEQTIYLMVKSVDTALDVYIYFPVPGLEPGSRQDLLDRGCQWLFQAPPSEDRFDPADLRFSTTVNQTVDGPNGQPLNVVYGLKSQGEVQCRYREEPARSGMSGDLLATVVEYRTDQQVENPEFLVLEVGAQRSHQSQLQFFLGCLAKLSEVDVLPV